MVLLIFYDIRHFTPTTVLFFFFFFFLTSAPSQNRATITCVARLRHPPAIVLEWMSSGGHSHSQPAKSTARNTTIPWGGFLSHYGQIFVVFFFFNIDELIDWLLRWSIDLNLHPSVCRSTMARGEGAEQCAATLLAVKPLNADIKTAKVRNSHFLSTAVSVCAPNCKAAPHLEVQTSTLPLDAPHTPLRRGKPGRLNFSRILRLLTRWTERQIEIMGDFIRIINE